MPGLDQNRVIGVSHKELEHLVCSLCQKVFVYPLTTRCCAKTYCGECIEYWLTLNNVCPNDKQVMDSNAFIETPEEIMRQLSYLRVKCEYHVKGCQTVVRLSEMNSHLMNCEFNVCSECGLEKGSLFEHNCFENIKKRLDSITNENQTLKRTRMDVTKMVGTAKKNINNYVIKSFKGFNNVLLDQFVKHCKLIVESKDSIDEIAKDLFLIIKDSFKFSSIKWVVLVNNANNSVACLSHAKYVLDICFGYLEIKIIGFK